MKLSALRTGRLYPPPPQGNITGTHFCQRLSQPQGHSTARRIVSMKYSNDTGIYDILQFATANSVVHVHNYVHFSCNSADA